MTDKRLKVALLVCLGLLIVWAGISVFTVGRVPAGVLLGRLAPAFIAFLAAAWIFGRGRDRSAGIAGIVLCIITLLECILGLCQLIGMAESRHPMYKLTGDFYNPGLYGCLMAIGLVCSVTLLLRKPGRRAKRLAVCTAVLSLILLAVSQSRASWLGAGVALAIVAFRESDILLRIKHKAAVFSIAAVVIIGAGIGAYALKPKSANARLHMWQMECLAIADHPLLGAGPGSELPAYMQAQEDYYRLKERDFDRQMAAASPHAVFNEFLKIGVGSGIPALVLAIAVFALTLALLLRRRSVLAYALIALGVFSLFSYPFTQEMFKILTAVCIAGALGEERQSSRKASIAQGVIAAVLCAALIPFVYQGINRASTRRHIVLPKENADAAAYLSHKVKTLQYERGFMLDYGRELFLAKQYSKSLEALELAQATEGDPALYTVMGECYHNLGMPDKAQEYFLKAHYRYPALLSPVLRLMVLYYQYGGIDEARLVRDYGLSLPVDTSQEGTKLFHEVLEKMDL